MSNRERKCPLAKACFGGMKCVEGFSWMKTNYIDYKEPSTRKMLTFMS